MTAICAASNHRIMKSCVWQRIRIVHKGLWQCLLVVFRRCWPSILAFVITDNYALTEWSWHVHGRRESAHLMPVVVQCTDIPYYCILPTSNLWLELITVLLMKIQVYLWISTSKENGAYLQPTRVAHLLPWLRRGLDHGSYSNNVRLWVHWNLGFTNSRFVPRIST
jgi:hypothetical protein